MHQNLLIQKAREISNRFPYKSTPADEILIEISTAENHACSKKNYPVCFNHLDEEFVSALEGGEHLACILSETSKL